MAKSIENENDIDIVKESSKSKLKRPPLYKVILNNDDYTPMEFVIEVLIRFFSMDIEKANQKMLQVHHQGRAIVGTYTADVAETKVSQVNQFSRDNEHPLLCTMEQE